jgi:hypothetical protein
MKERDQTKGQMKTLWVRDALSLASLVVLVRLLPAFQLVLDRDDLFIQVLAIHTGLFIALYTFMCHPQLLQPHMCFACVFAISHLLCIHTVLATGMALKASNCLLKIYGSLRTRLIALKRAQSDGISNEGN